MKDWLWIVARMRIVSSEIDEARVRRIAAREDFRAVGLYIGGRISRTQTMANVDQLRDQDICRSVAAAACEGYSLSPPYNSNRTMRSPR